MKKVLLVMLSITMIACAFTACSSGDKDNKDASTTVATTVASTKTITTDDAKIAEFDAVNLIKMQYSPKELGLTEEEYKKASFMVSNSGEKIDKDYYVKVVAVYKKAHQNEDGKTTYTFDNKGIYYIRYDGKQILREDVKTGDRTEMKVKKVPETTTVKPAHPSTKAAKKDSKSKTTAKAKTTAKPKTTAKKK